MKVGISFVHFDKNQEYIDNTLFFINQGYIPDNQWHFTYVCNGESSIEFPSKENVEVIRKKNSGFDFGGHAAAVDKWKSSGLHFDFYLFINNSCRGPFVPSYAKKYFKWTDPFTDLITDQVKLVGCTINSSHRMPKLAHVQSYLFCLDKTVFDYLDAVEFFSMNETKQVRGNAIKPLPPTFDFLSEDDMTLAETELGIITIPDSYKKLIMEKELGLSMLIKRHGWNISCLIPEFQNIDYRKLNKVLNPDAALYGGDMIYPGQRCFGRDIHPYEVLFIKTARDVAADTIHSLTNQLQ